MEFKIFFLGLLIGISVVSLKCTAMSSNNKYLFGIFTKSNWFLASQFCAFNNMTLVTLDTQSERDELYQELQRRDTKEAFWTAGNDLGKEGSFAWSSSGHAFIFTDWDSGEPNNVEYPGGYDEDCVVLKYDTENKDYKWNDVPCTYDYFYICQKINRPVEIDRSCI